MSFDKKDVLTLISLGINVILGIFSKDVENPYVLAGIIALCAGMIVGIMLYWKEREVRQLSNSGVIAKSRKYTKYMMKLVNVNSKMLKKEKSTTEWKRIHDHNKKIIDYMKKEDLHVKKEEMQNKLSKLEKERDLDIKKAYLENESYIPKNGLTANEKLMEIAQLSNLTQSQKTSEIVCETIMSMQRVLLELEQYKLRIKFGEYLVKYSSNIDQVIAGYVDFLGWTYILEGKVNKGKEYVKQGIQFINAKIENAKADPEGYPEGFNVHRYEILKARALRHLGTTYYTYKGKNYDEVDSCLVEAIKLMKTPFFMEVLPKALKDSIENDKLIREKGELEEDKDSQLTADLKKMNGDYDKMIFGLKYNHLLLKFYKYSKSREKSPEELDYIENEINKLYKDMQNRDVDSHRAVKILTLKNQISRNQMILGDKESRIQAYKSYNKYKGDLLRIEKILNGNIYFDEAMEVYIYQKVQCLYRDVEEILTNSNPKQATKKS